MRCTLTVGEVPLHLYQVIAGFEKLASAGRIVLTYKTPSPDADDRLPYNVLAAECDSKCYLFDMNDGYDNLPENRENYISFYNALLDRCDLLYKRSFHAPTNARLTHPEKMQKTPPNCLITINGSRAHRPVPCDPRREKLKKMVRSLPVSSYYNGHCYEDALEDLPRVRSSPRVIFLARLWDPAGEFPGQLNAEKTEERFQINESRATCIRTCRREFGDRFEGGVSASAFSQREYPDLVVTDKKVTRKDKYIAAMKEFDIAIATAGLHKSTGWKFAEYLTASKAIVTEPLFYESAGALCEGVNYLSFRDERDCCEKIYRLFDESSRYTMMCANREYYTSTMRCDKFVAAAIGLE